MTSHYKADLSGLGWEHPIVGVKHKYFDRDNLRLRLVEYSKNMTPHWCEKGHYGYVVEGRMEIEYENDRVTYNPGDGIFIPDGPEHKHRGRVSSDKAVIYLLRKCKCSSRHPLADVHLCFHYLKIVSATDKPTNSTVSHKSFAFAAS